MGNKDRPGKPSRKHKARNIATELAQHRAKRRERKHTLKTMRRNARRHGLLPPITPVIK